MSTHSPILSLSLLSLFKAVSHFSLTASTVRNFIKDEASGIEPVWSRGHQTKSHLSSTIHGFGFSDYSSFKNVGIKYFFKILEKDHKYLQSFARCTKVSLMGANLDLFGLSIVIVEFNWKMIYLNI